MELFSFQCWHFYIERSANLSGISPSILRSFDLLVSSGAPVSPQIRVEAIMALVLSEVRSCSGEHGQDRRNDCEFCLTGDFSQRSRCVHRCNLLACLRERLDCCSIETKNKNIHRDLLTVQVMTNRVRESFNKLLSVTNLTSRFHGSPWRGVVWWRCMQLQLADTRVVCQGESALTIFCFPNYKL